MTLTILAVLALSSLLIAALGVPLWLEKVPPNALYGFRTPLTVHQPDVWYPVNKASGRDLVISGLVSALLPLFYAGAIVEPDVGVMFGLWLAPILLGVLHSFWVASNIAAERLEQGTKQEEPDKEARRRPQRQRETET